MSSSGTGSEGPVPRMPIERVLIVEDRASLLRSLERTLARRFPQVRGCRTRREAETLLVEFVPQLVVLDVALPDGDAFDVLRATATLASMPTVIAMSGAARSDQAFDLARLGVRAFIRKPLTTEALDRALVEALSVAPDLGPHLRETVGRRAIREVEAEVRETMVKEALSRSDGSRRGAARLLHISRQALQHILRRAR